MDYHTQIERRKATLDSLREALDNLQHRGATGIEIQAAGGVRATGDWARVWNDKVTIFSTVMGVAAAIDLNLADVVTVETVWSDVRPPFVAPARFDAEFNRMFVDAVHDIMGISAIGDAVHNGNDLLQRYEKRDDLTLQNQDSTHSLLIGALPRTLRPRDDYSYLNVPLTIMVKSSPETMRRILSKLTPAEAKHIVPRDVNDGDGTLGVLAGVNPAVATEALIEHIRNQIRAVFEPYMLADSIQPVIEKYVGEAFRRAEPATA